MKKYISNHEKAFKQRLLEAFYFSVIFSQSMAILSFITYESFGDKNLILKTLKYVAFCYVFFGIPLTVFNYFSNRFLIYELAFDSDTIYLKYYDFSNKKKLKYPLNRVEIKLVQWYHADSVYLKITTDKIKIKQYRGGAWNSDQLHEIFKALKDAQKNLEVEPE